MGRVVRMRAVRCPWGHGRKTGGSGTRPYARKDVDGGVSRKGWMLGHVVRLGLPGTPDRLTTNGWGGARVDWMLESGDRVEAWQRGRG